MPSDWSVRKVGNVTIYRPDNCRTAFLHQECASRSLYLWHEISHKAQTEAQCSLSFTENGLGVHFSITPKMILIQVLL